MLTMHRARAALLVMMVASVAQASLVRDIGMESLESEDGQKVVLFCSGDNCAEVPRRVSAVC
jgi:hypothetical protein